MDARTSNEIDCVVLYSRLHASARNFQAATQDLVAVWQRFDIDLIATLGVETCVPAREHFALMFLIRIVQNNFELKSIELRFRERIRSFVLDGVLSRQHGEYRRQLISIAVDC